MYEVPLTVSELHQSQVKMQESIGEKEVTSVDTTHIRNCERGIRTDKREKRGSYRKDYG